VFAVEQMTKQHLILGQRLHIIHYTMLHEIRTSLHLAITFHSVKHFQ